MGSDIDDLLDDVIDDGVDVAFALKVLLWWNGLCDDDEACFDIIVGDVIVPLVFQSELGLCLGMV